MVALGIGIRVVALKSARHQVGERAAVVEHNISHAGITDRVLLFDGARLAGGDWGTGLIGKKFDGRRSMEAESVLAELFGT